MKTKLKADLLVVGGGVGGYAAAWAALRQGLHVVLSEEYDRLGGQFTSQAVPPDEHPWIEHFGGTRSYRQLRQTVRDYYKRFYPLSEQAAAAPYLNPGNGCVSALCHEPRVSQAVMEAFLAPYLGGGQLTVLLNHQPVNATLTADRHVTSVTLQRALTSDQITVEAPYYIDATELGDLLPLTNTDFVVGAEAKADTHEPHAADQRDPHNQQAISWCFVVDYDPQENHTIAKPESYEFWRDYLPPLTPAWGGPLLSWTATHPITLEPVTRSFSPLHPQPERGPMDLWTFRRIAHKENFRRGAYASDIVLVNWPQIDYLLGPLIGVTPEEKERHLRGARELSLSMLYWMQTEAPRDDGKRGWPGLRLRPDVTGTSDGLAAAPYIRESRRIKGMTTVLEQHVGLEARMAETNLPAEQVEAYQFADSVGIGAYRIDLHPSTGGDNYIDVSALPFQIPLGALIPQETDNLLAGGKNLSVTHITNGCYRLHPVEWNVGEAAGLCTAFCLANNCHPHQVYAQPELLQSLQELLVREGIELSWPKVKAL